MDAKSQGFNNDSPLTINHSNLGATFNNIINNSTIAATGQFSLFSETGFTNNKGASIKAGHGLTTSAHQDHINNGTLSSGTGSNVSFGKNITSYQGTYERTLFIQLRLYKNVDRRGYFDSKFLSLRE